MKLYSIIQRLKSKETIFVNSKIIKEAASFDLNKAIVLISNIELEEFIQKVENTWKVRIKYDFFQIKYEIYKK